MGLSRGGARRTPADGKRHPQPASFAYVFLPRLPEGPATRWVDETESAHKERVELDRRELFVGITRARDGLWLGFVHPRSGGPTAATS